MGNIEFVQANAFKFQSSRLYALVWSAGVLDYLSDRLAIRFIRRAFKAVRPGGEVAIGNFSLTNPSQPYMEVVGRWYLFHRSPTELARLGAEAVATPCAIRVGMESEAVNLFLHMLRACETVAEAS